MPQNSEVFLKIAEDIVNKVEFRSKLYLTDNQYRILKEEIYAELEKLFAQRPTEPR